MPLLGERLRQAREARGISTYQVEIDTRIRAILIESLEQGEYADLPPEPFLRGLIRNYSAYLAIDAEEMLALYVADITPPPPPPPVSPMPIAPPPIQQSVAPPPPPASEPEALPEQPKKKIAPPPLMPKPSEPPEKLPPPETLEAKETQPGTFRASLAHFTRRPPPLPVILAIAGTGLIACLIVGLVIVSSIASVVANLQPPATPTRVPPTRTPTSVPGAQPTGIPTLAETVAPFPTFPGNPTPTLAVTPRPSGETTLALDVQVTDTVKIQVGIDGVMVFDGTLSAGSSQSWGARDTLYVRVENPRGAIITLNGNARWFAARNFAETRIVERQFGLNERGAVVSQTPLAPPELKPAATPTISIPIPIAPTPTLTPFS